MQLEPHKSFALRSDAAAHSTLGLRPANGVAMAASGVGPLLRDKRPVPGENGLGTHEGCKLREQCPAEGLSPDGEASALNVSESHSAAAKLRAEDAVLLAQVVDGVLLVAVKPGGESEDQESDLERERDRGRSRLPDRRRNLTLADTFGCLFCTLTPGKSPMVRVGFIDGRSFMK